MDLLTDADFVEVLNDLPEMKAADMALRKLRCSGCGKLISWVIPNERLCVSATFCSGCLKGFGLSKRKPFYTGCEFSDRGI